MELLLPVGDVCGSDVVREGAARRQFVVFDEQLSVHLQSVGDGPAGGVQLGMFSVWINEAKLYEAQCDGLFRERSENWWSLDCCADGAPEWFRSTVAMNNGYDNTIRFKVTWRRGAGDGQSIGEQGGTRDAEASREDEFLPSFEPIYSLAAGPGSGSGSATAGATADATAPATVPGDVYDEHTSVELPIYSLLNMRLRNSNLPRNTCILSSLDVQTAKAVLQLAHRHSLTNPQLVFQDVLFELVDKRGSHVALECLDDGVSKSLPQMTLTPHDSVSLVYRLPPVERAIGQLAAHRHRARVVLRYSLHTLEGHTIPIWTQWHTDITVKPVGRPLGISNNTLSRVSSLSLASTPRFHRTLESTVPIPSSSPPPMHNIRYTFLKESIQVQQCDQFILRVQITNLSPTASRDLVIYYNNHTLPDSHAAATNLTLERQATRQRRLARHAEGIVLLSNDYKLPALHPGGTHLVDLQFVAVQRGHYARLPGLKLLDLPTGDTVDIGNGASVLVE